MDKKAKEAYRTLIQPRYRRASKLVKQRILDEFCAVCGYHRKYAIALLTQPVRRKKAAKKKSGRKPVYHDPQLLKVLYRLWLETEFACGGTLKGNFAWSLTATDIKTTWTEIRAVWNKGAHEVMTQMEDIEKSLP